MRRALLSILAAGGLWLVSTPASAVTLNIVANGLTSLTSNYACDTGFSNCSTQRTLQLDSPVTVSGTITLNASLTTATLDLHFSSANFAPISSGSAVTLTGVTMTGSVPIAAFGSTVAQLGPGSGTVSGSVAGYPFSVSPTIFNFTCSSLTGAGQCGVQFGAAGYGAIAGHYFVNTVNVLTTPVPEPAAALLLLAGIAGLAARRSLR